MTSAVDPNGLVTRWQHDGLGRVTEELRPDGTRSTVALARHKSGGPGGAWWSVEVTTKEDGGAIRTETLDSLGRPVRALTVAAEVQACGKSHCAPALVLEEETHYDFLGRIDRVALPWMSGDALTGTLAHTYAYDAAGRLMLESTYELSVTSDRESDGLREDIGDCMDHEG